MPDASRSVPVVQALLSETGDKFISEVRADYARIRDQHRDKKGPGPLHPLAEARRLGHRIDWPRYLPPAPRKPGLTVLRRYPLAELADYIDWSPFFQAWELSGAYPGILQDAVVGEAARKLLGVAVVLTSGRVPSANDCHSRPINSSTIMTISTNPNPPLGQYPQLLLCGHAGMAPINIRIRTINRMVPKLMSFSSKL